MYHQGKLLYYWNFNRGDFDRVLNADFDKNENLVMRKEWLSDKQSAEKVVEDKSRWSFYEDRVLVVKKESGGVVSDFEYSLYQLYPNIFLLEMEQNDDLAMAFLRCQTFYEWDEFKGKEFTIDEFKRWFCKNFPSANGKFTYPKEFYGFNVPSSAIMNCYTVNDERNKYDNFFLDRVMEIMKRSTDFYLIGIRSGDHDTLDHELAHAFFWSDEDYRNDMTALVNKLPDKEKMLNILSTERGYGEDVLIDEAQAFMATGLIQNISAWEKHREPFIKRFKEKMGDFKIPKPISEKKELFLQE
jgi:hypothetical protein